MLSFVYKLLIIQFILGLAHSKFVNDNGAANFMQEIRNHFEKLKTEKPSEKKPDTKTIS